MDVFKFDNVRCKKMCKRKTLWNILFLLGMILTGWIIATLLEVAVYCIPTGDIRENISRGVGIYNSETNFYMFADGYLSTMNDNDSDSVILCETAYSSGRPLYDAMASVYPGGNETRVNNIIAYSNFHDDDYSMYSYARYWHGYVVLLKPLFCFFDFADMRVIMYIVEILLYMLVGIEIAKHFGDKYLWAYFGFLVLMNPIIIALSYQYVPCTCIALFAALLIMKMNIQDKDITLQSRLFLEIGGYSLL